MATVRGRRPRSQGGESRGGPGWPSGLAFDREAQAVLKGLGQCGGLSCTIERPPWRQHRGCLAEEAGDRVLLPGLSSILPRVHPTKAAPLSPNDSPGAPGQGGEASPGSSVCWAWGTCGMDPPLVLLEVELGDHHGLFGRVGEADGPVGLECCAEEPAGAGGRLEAGGGPAV